MVSATSVGLVVPEVAETVTEVAFSCSVVVRLNAEEVSVSFVGTSALLVSAMEVMVGLGVGEETKSVVVRLASDVTSVNVSVALTPSDVATASEVLEPVCVVETDSDVVAFRSVTGCDVDVTGSVSLTISVDVIGSELGSSVWVAGSVVSLNDVVAVSFSDVVGLSLIVTGLVTGSVVSDVALNSVVGIPEVVTLSEMVELSLIVTGLVTGAVESDVALNSVVGNSEVVALSEVVAGSVVISTVVLSERTVVGAIVGVVGIGDD